MGRSRHLWWGYVAAVIRAWPERERQDGGLTAQERREQEAVRAALEATAAGPDGRWRTAIVRAVLIRRTHTLQGAALRWCGGSYSAAKEVVRAFKMQVARGLGLL